MKELEQIAERVIPAEHRKRFSYSFAGGKRIRPLLMKAVCERLSVPFEPLLYAAFGVEMLHSSTLLHDDVVDQDRERRGRESFYQNFSPKEAVLYGDYFAVRAMRIFQEHYPTLVEKFTQALESLVEGQLMEFTPLKDRDHWTEYANKKTASLFRLTAQIPCVFSGKPSQEIAAWGQEFGIAFQIANDLKKSGETHSLLAFLTREEARTLLEEKIAVLEKEQLLPVKKILR